MRVFVVRQDDCYGGGALILGVWTAESAAKECAEKHAAESGAHAPVKWAPRSGDEDCDYPDVWEGRPGGFSLAEFSGFAYAISAHDIDEGRS